MNDDVKQAYNAGYVAALEVVRDSIDRLIAGTAVPAARTLRERIKEVLRIAPNGLRASEIIQRINAEGGDHTEAIRKELLRQVGVHYSRAPDGRGWILAERPGH